MSDHLIKVHRTLLPQGFGRQIPRILMPLLTTPEKWLFARGILSPKWLSLPDFLGIGAPQSGTTWLFENLRRHPEIFMPERKELRYFETNFHKSLSQYYAPKFRPGAGRIKGEISPSYGKLTLPRIRFIRRIMPELIYILRNPIDRMWAATRRALAKTPGRSLDHITEEEAMVFFHYPWSRKQNDYPTNLDNWLSIFPREQLFVGFYDAIARDPQSLLRQIFSFLGVSSDVDWNGFPYGQVINKNPESPIPARCREFLEQAYAADIENLYQRFGDAVRSWRCSEKLRRETIKPAQT